MSSEEYVENRGGRCPVCGSDLISGDFIEINGTEAFQNITCGACQSSWTDVYKLDRYEDLDYDPELTFKGEGY